MPPGPLAPDAPARGSALGEEIAAGRPVVLMQAEGRAARGYLLAAAEAIDPVTVEFMTAHGGGLPLAAMRTARLAELAVPVLPETGRRARDLGAPMHVGVDSEPSRHGGGSSESRARTLRRLANPRSRAEEFSYPGHVFPVGVGSGSGPGVAERALALLEEAGAGPVAALCEISWARDGLGTRARVVAFARRHGMPLVDPADPRLPGGAEPLVAARVPRRDGEARAAAFLGADGHEHMVLLYGSVEGGELPVYLHRSCLLGDAFGSLACDCGRRLREAIGAVEEHGTGAVLYLRGDPCERLARCDHRARGERIETAAEILARLGASRLRLLGDADPDADLLRRRGFTVLS